MTSLQFPASAEPLIRKALQEAVERIPLGATGPLWEASLLPVEHVGLTPTVPWFTLVEDDCTPLAADGVAEEDDNA